jgi:hypothetical protein
MLQAADLGGLDGIHGDRRLQAEPYASSLYSRGDAYAQGTGAGAGMVHTPFDESSVDAGVDLRDALTSTLVANLTVNPDYSQVEADAIQIDVNQRYPLFYPEKRPFFLEGADLFSTPLDLVYTRRIADPVAGVKLTGRAGRVGLGAISVREDGGGSMEGVGAGGSVPVRPGEFHIGRVSYDSGENSRLGVLVTAHLRDQAPEGMILTGVPPPFVQGGANLVAAGDAKLRLAPRLFFTGQLAWSSTRFDSSARADGGQIVAHDEFRDVAYTGSLRYADGTTEVELFQNYVGPDFRDESGFVPRVDMRRTGINSSVTLRPENHWLRSLEPILDGYAIHNHSGGLEEWWVSPMVDWLLRRQNHVHTMYVRSMERWLSTDYTLNTYILNLDTSRWRSVTPALALQVGDGIWYGETSAESFRGWSENVNASLTLRPSPRLTAELTASRQLFTRSRGGEEVSDVWVLGGKTTFQFTRRLYARIYPQFDTGSQHLDADGLLGYVLHPGSVIYLGVNGDYDHTFGRQRPTQRSVFFKVSHRFDV